MAQPSPITVAQPDASAPGVESAARVAEPEGWRELRGDDEIQFDEFTIAPPEVREPGWFDEAWQGFAEFMADMFGPVGEFLARNWDVMQWVLLGLLGLFAAYWLVRSLGPIARMHADAKAQAGAAQSDPNWQPTAEESLALLEDADRLAAQGRFDEATHLLLKRSVNQISTARPEWVDPSSTARELAALPALSDPARNAFRAISQRVERSLFALRALEQSDWEAARAAYADFASISIGAKASDKVRA